MLLVFVGVVLGCMWLLCVEMLGLGSVGVGMVGMFDDGGDCCVGMYCRCWLGGCWLFVLIVSFEVGLRTGSS